jgi:hypothetical protein
MKNILLIICEGCENLRLPVRGHILKICPFCFYMLQEIASEFYTDGNQFVLLLLRLKILSWQFSLTYCHTLTATDYSSGRHRPFGYIRSLTG